MRKSGGVLLVLLLTSLLASPPAFAQTVAAAPAAELTTAQQKEFLAKAKVIRNRTTNRGVTAPKLLTLTDGVITHDAVFQSVDESKMVVTLGGNGRASQTELNFVDSYRYNLAAYALSELLGLDYMMPVHVERRWGGQTGSMSWFVDTLMDESDRLKKKVQPPNSTEWNYQMYRMRVFSALVRDTDRNLTNVLITPEWKVMMIDFSRGFRLQPELMHQSDLARMCKDLWAKLQNLQRDEVKKATGDWLTASELDAMMKRRDLLVAHFSKLIAEKGEANVLY
ncbi:MAG TPA: hypothetical protein VFP85_02535 [Vicinamibacterales bacterium]|nr:hypothetical protein [Vicinamibacterales bacterium]